MHKMKFKRLIRGADYWNRKVHIHLGLGLLLFIWLFSFSGLLLNHGEWTISNFWDKRKESKTVTAICMPVSRDSVTVLSNLMEQLHIAGEITNVQMWPDSVHFQVSIPGRVSSVQVNFKSGQCTQTRLTFNLAGVVRTLHTFNGVNKNDAAIHPNWLLTSAWKLSMDAIGIGLILLCISSWIMWYKIRGKYSWGLVALISGLGMAVYFVFVLLRL
jgi:hypothetical protein